MSGSLSNVFIVQLTIVLLVSLIVRTKQEWAVVLILAGAGGVGSCTKQYLLPALVCCTQATNQTMRTCELLVSASLLMATSNLPLGRCPTCHAKIVVVLIMVTGTMVSAVIQKNVAVLIVTVLF